MTTTDDAVSRTSTVITDEVDSQWHFIDSPCHTLLTNPKIFRNSQLSIDSRASRTSRFFDLTNSRPDPLIAHILNSVSIEEIDRLNVLRRAEARHSSLFALYPLEEESSLIECRPAAGQPKEHLGHRILVKCLSLKVELEIEPIFASLALYDAKERRKISENFYFDLNTEQTKRLLLGHIPYQDLSTLSRSCIFNITYPTSDMFLVIKLEKVLQGDFTEAYDPHFRDDKHKERLRTNTQLYCDRLGKYRQPFAWAAVYLMDIFSGLHNSFPSISDMGSLDRRGLLDATRKRPESSNSLNRKESLERVKMEKWRSWTSEEVADAINNFQPVTTTINTFFKQDSDRLRDEDLYKYLNDLKKPSSILKKLKSIPAVFRLDISPCPEEQPKYGLTPDLVRLHPYPDEKVRPVKEILEFPQKEVYHPHYHYRNLLFVYPKNLNFTNRQGSARNITCKIQLMSGEDDYSALPVIFGKSGCPEYLSEVYTSITYHNKAPDFNDEIKIKLPPKLTEQHHLLFTFNHISCQKTKQHEQNPVETPIGYTWLPLYRDGRLQTGSFGLPVMIEKPPASYSFLSPSIQIPNIKWYDNHRDVFTISIDTVSSLHSQDNYVDYFLRLSTLIDNQEIPQKLQNANIESEFKSCILSLSQANLEPLVKFFPLVMNKLIKLLVRPPNLGGTHILNIGQTVFEAMAAILKKVSSLPESNNSNPNGRCQLISTFIQYQCLFPHPDVIPTRFINNQDASSVFTVTDSANRHTRSNSNPNVNVEPDLIRYSTTKPLANLERTSSLRSPNHLNCEEIKVNNVNKAFVPVRKLFFEELLLQWVVANGNAKEYALSNAWVFFDMIIKSATENLALIGALQSPRKLRFSQQFNDDLTSLFSSLVIELVNRIARDVKDMKLIHNLNHSLGFFIRDLWSIADRGFVFSLVKNYCNQVTNSRLNGISSESINNQLIILKIDFLRIICNYEHFFALNLPFNSPLFVSNDITKPPSYFSLTSHESLLSTLTLLDRIGSFSEVSSRYRKQHFLVGLALASFTQALETSNVFIQTKAVNLVRSLLTSHDWDPRYTEPDVKGRICSLYLPLLSIIIDALPQLCDYKADTTFLKPTFKRLDNKRKPILLSSMESIDCESTINSIDHTIAMAIAGGNLHNTNNNNKHSTEKTLSKNLTPRRFLLREETTRDLLICFLWVLKNTSSTLYKRWLSEQSLHRIAQLIDVLDICVSRFQYKGQQAAKVLSTITLRKNINLKSKLEDAIMGMGSARRELILRRRDRSNSAVLSSQSFSQSDGTRWRKDSFQATRYSSESLKLNSRNKFELENEIILEGHMVYEITMVLLDSMENIIFVLCQDLDTSSDYYKQCQSLVGNILQVLIHILSVNQSTKALENVYATQRSILMKFPNLLFEERLDRELLSELSLQLLRHCSSAIGSVRAQASASLYLLMRQNFGIPSNFARIKMQVTMSLSSLVGTNQKFSEHFLRRSLKTILTYALCDQEMQDSTFSEQVQELVFNLHMILSDTIRMKEYQEDPDMLIDLMYRIAKGYQHSPDLRLTWLANMAQKHIEKGHHAEAAQCFIHSAAMVAEYLYVIGKKPYLPMSCVAFQRISANILEESNISSEIPADKEGLYTGKSFSENGLIALLEKAANCLMTPEMYEAVNEVYKLLIPICEAHKDYNKLAFIYGKLRDIFTKLHLADGKRTLGSFFRVGFYGSKFGDLDREEFVYKEPSLTKLPEIAHRLESFYSEQFGPEFVEVIKDSNPVDSSRFDPEKAYLQITYVEPYFDPWEIDHRSPLYEKNYNISK